MVTVWVGLGPDHYFPSTPRPLTGTYSYLLTVLSRIKDKAGLLLAGEGRVANKLNVLLKWLGSLSRACLGTAPLGPHQYLMWTSWMDSVMGSG